MPIIKVNTSTFSLYLISRRYYQNSREELRNKVTYREIMNLIRKVYEEELARPDVILNWGEWALYNCGFRSYRPNIVIDNEGRYHEGF